ncbi:Multicopy suppressor of sporulation protein msa1 [Lachnellula cervina]|uniref:Multicopy suppressor of sporulation protein msa1 n=1 Tax=Lachnellula cervina TaxID=1316786 RepID=A0A7D8UN76_9HELO|nr:Multicopy suppressor of sporulation protein msa1 [Lachnellula cervina]
MSCTDGSFSAASDTGDDSQSLMSGISTGGVPIANLANLTISDEQAVDVKSEASGTYSIDTTKDNDSKGFSPSKEAYRPPFIIKGSQAEADDIFRSSPHHSSSNQSNQRTPTGPKAGRGRMNGNWRSPSMSDGSDGISSPSHEKVQRDATKRNGIRTPGQSPHNHDGYEIITDNDAQARFPPSCCVFVANLLQSENEEALQAAVTKVFSEYGVVFVKIRRDTKQMPFAFCQYTSLLHAERAIREGRGRLINGRPCRTEKAKAHRLFFVERKYGPIVTPEEVRKMMFRYGTITSCYTASNVERAALNLNEGVIIEFEMYDEGQDAFNAYRANDVFKMSPINGMVTPPRSDPANRAYLDRYHADRSSIFVGTLPSSVTEDQLREIFESFGPIVEILIKITPSRYDPDESICFAFIEFRSWDSVTRILDSKHNFTINGKPIRVSQKGVIPARRSRVQDDSPARLRAEPPVSPMSVSSMAPQSPSQYGFYGSSPMSYQSGTALYTDGNGQYYYAAASPYTSPSYYSPSYAAASPAQQAYWPQAQPFYWGGYPAPSYGSYTPASHPQPVSSPPSSYPASYSPSASAAGQVDRSATPTPAGHPESAHESQ